MNTLKSLKIHHIGYLVKNMDKASAEFSALGYDAVNEKTRDDIRGVDILFMEKDGYRIELISPFRNDSVVSGLMKRYKNSPYHICYETDDPDSVINELISRGYAEIDTPTPAPAIGNQKVEFLTHPKLGMIELLL